MSEEAPAPQPRKLRMYILIRESVPVGFAVLDPHEVFEGKDPIWPGWMVEQAAKAGLAAYEMGRMVKPDNFAEIEAEVTARINRAHER